MSDTPTDGVPEDFVLLVRERLLRQRGDAVVTVLDDGALGVEIPGRNPMRVALYNLWRDIDAYTDKGPQDLTGPVDRFVERTLAPVPEIEDLQASLRLVFKPEGEAAALGDAFVSRHDIEGLRTMLVADAGPSFQYVRHEHLEEEELTVEEALERAWANTRAVIDEHLELHRGEAVMLTCGGDFEASALLHYDLWRKLGEDVGPLVAGVPARDLVFATSLSNREGIAQLQDLVADAVQRQVSHAHLTGLLRFTGDGWVPWAPSPLTLRTRPFHALLKRFEAYPEATVIELPGWLSYVEDADGVPQQIDAPTLNLLVKEDILGSRLQVEARDGYLEVTREEGEVANLPVLAVRALEELAPDGADGLLFAIPDPHRVWLAQRPQSDRLRRALAQTDAPQLVFQVQGDDAALWPGQDVCTQCAAAVPSHAFWCWRCQDPVLDGLWLRHMGGAVVVAAAIVAVWYALGWSENPLPTTGALWFHLFWLGWPVTAVARGHALRKAVRQYATGLQRYLLFGSPLLVLWRLPGFIDTVQKGPIDDTAPGLVGFLLYPTVMVSVLIVFLLTVGLLGPGVLKIWEDEPADVA